MTITPRVGGSPSGGISSRVSEAPVGGQTSRIHHLLLLEGDEEGYLLLEGDMQSGDDALELEGDETAIGGTQTKRVTL